MTNKIEVINMHLANPLWTAREIAQALNCRITYVNNVSQRCDLDIPRERGRRGESMQALGRAAFRAGLTLKKIEAMGVSK